MLENSAVELYPVKADGKKGGKTGTDQKRKIFADGIAAALFFD